MAFNATGIQGNPSFATNEFQQVFGVNPVLYGQNIQFNSLQTNNLVQSDAVMEDPYLANSLLNAGTEIIEPFYNDLYGDAEVWNDQMNINPDSFSAGQERAVKLYQAKSFGFTDFSQLVDFGNPLSQITSRFGNFWQRQNTKAIMNILNGTFANAKIASTNVYDGSANEFNVTDFEKASSLLGAYQDTDFSTLFVHPSVYAQMKAENYITLTGNETPLSQSAQPIATYNGMRVIMDEQLPFDAQSGVATSYLVGKGAIMFSAAAALNGGFEYYRNPLTAGGRTDVVSKRVITGHVHGTTVSDNYQPDNKGFSIDDYANGDMWDCVVNPEYIHLVAYRSKVPAGYKNTTVDEGAIAEANRTSQTARNNSRKRGSASSSASTSTTTSSSASSSSASK